MVGSLAIPDSVLSRARQVAREIGRAAAALGGSVFVDADEILTGRAAILGLQPAGLISAGGSTRLLATRDGWCALTLSRDDDVEAVPALLESSGPVADPWAALTTTAADRRAAELVERARLLDLPAAVLGEVTPAAPTFVRRGATAARAVGDLLVADLSSMWAGPLCGQLLAAAGATVVKVEGRNRPDGTRSGHPGFFDWMNSSKLSYAIDFRDAQLRPLLEVADVVIEGSRPAALARRGLGPDQVPGRPGRVWLRVTGYGSDGDRAYWIAFGDDAAVAGGLVGAAHARSKKGPSPAFVGDAIADPLTGMEATLAVLEALGRGGGEVVEISLAAVAASYAALPSIALVDNGERLRVPAPPRHSAALLGADNDRVRELIEARHATC
ncbi:MAG: CoA transferase [Mycobacterium sp.]